LSSANQSSSYRAPCRAMAVILDAGDSEVLIAPSIASYRFASASSRWNWPGVAGCVDVAPRPMTSCVAPVYA
jgi:hypothetical protein